MNQLIKLKTKQTNKQTSKQTNEQRSKPTNKQTNKQTNKRTNEQTNKQTNKQANNIAPKNQKQAKQVNNNKKDASTEIIESAVNTSTFSKSQQAYCTPARSHQETFKKPYPNAIYNISGQVYTTCFVGHLNKWWAYMYAIYKYHTLCWFTKESYFTTLPS